MPIRIAMVFGRTIWARNAGVWRSETFDDSGTASRASVARLAEALSSPPAERRIGVFEPEWLAHQSVEVPKVGRAAFAPLARVRNEYPVVESENLGWGIEY